MNNFLFYSVTWFFISTSLCFSTSLSEFVNKLEKEDFFKNATLSIYVVSEKDKKVVFNHQGEKSVIPNSILKVITTAAALKVLGEDFQFKTQLLASGLIKEDILDGDLVVLGDGDPTLGSNRQECSLSDEEQLKEWSLVLKNQGIKQVKGSIVGNASCFEKALAPATWLWEDLGNYYGAGACGLNFHENFYTIFFKMGQVIGDLTTIDKVDPFISDLKLINEVVSASKGTGDRAYVFGGEFSKTQYIRGTLPLDNSSFKIKGSIPDPAVFCAEHFKVALEKEGIAVEGQANSSFDKAVFTEKTLLYETYSPKLSKIVFLANKLSLNLYCEALLKKIGEVKKNKGTHLAGLEVVHEYLRELDISLEGFNILDGSGLSNKNLVTAKGMAEFLLEISKESYFPVLFQSLPCNTFKDLGRLELTFPKEALSGRIFAKTGYSSQGESFAGFFINNKGERFSFCIICNHFLGPSSVFREQMQRLFEILVLS